MGMLIMEKHRYLTLRATNVVSGEHGVVTQHIGAYQENMKIKN